MEKVLSIIIPTYNMEALLPRCLDSILAAHEIGGGVEAVVVNDGSKDGSLAVARAYEEEWGEVVCVIDKPNGNYGSTINAALPVVKGRYVRVLDSDDEVNASALAKEIERLRTLDVDVVLTHHEQVNADGSVDVIRYNTMGKEPYVYGKRYDLEQVLSDGYIRYFVMHQLTYRTALLRDMGYRQTEGISYTDTEWATYPMYWAKSIVFLDLRVYRYHVDRAGQTMDPKVIGKSSNQLVTMLESLLSYYEKHIDEVGRDGSRGKWLKAYMENRLRFLYKLLLLDVPRDVFDIKVIEDAERRLLPIMERNGMVVKLIPANKVLRIDVYDYWRRKHRRLPKALEMLNRALDVVVLRIYRFLVNR